MELLGQGVRASPGWRAEKASAGRMRAGRRGIGGGLRKRGQQILGTRPRMTTEKEEKEGRNNDSEMGRAGEERRRMRMRRGGERKGGG